MRAYLGSSPSTAMAVTLLPDPDSPTIPRTSFSKTSKETSSTAFSRPSSVGNSTARLRTDSTAPGGSTGAVSAVTRSSANDSPGDVPGDVPDDVPGDVPDDVEAMGSVIVGRLGVEGVAQAVAEEVHRQHGDQQHEAREVDEVGG